MIGRRRRGAQHERSVLRGADRYPEESPGIVTLHCFSAGAHYDETNLSFGALVGVDEHRLDPGAGFDRHAHRDVAIVTWVLEGALRHEDSTGAAAVIEPGTAAVQIAGRGVEHSQVNASATAPVWFVQTTVLCEAEEPSFRLAAPPVIAGPALFAVAHTGPVVLESPHAHLFVAEGAFGYGPDGLGTGDSLRVTASFQTPLETPTVEGSGTVLITLLR